MLAEVLDHRGRVVRRERLDHVPATFGRGRDCDVIVDDPKVCPLHAELVSDAERGYLLLDRNSVNGTRRAGFDARVAQLTVRNELTVRLGDTVIRLVTPDHPVSPAVVDRLGGLDRFAPMQSTSAAAVALAVTLGVLGIVESLSANSDSVASQALASILGYLVLGILWAGFWTLANRLTTRRYRFAAHLVWGLAMGTVIRVGALINAYLQFMLPGRDWVEGVFGLVIAAATLAAFYGHFALIGVQKPMTRSALAMGILTAFGTLGWLAADLGNDQLFGGLSFDHPIRPVPTALVKTTTADRFFERIDEVKAKVDSLAR